MTPRRFAPFSLLVCGYGFLVILWGYFLRISGSGDGCGTDWPLCHGAVVPAAPEFATLVEFTHRVSSGLVLVLVLAMVIWAFRAHPPGSAVRAGAGAALLFTLTESAVGAILVVFGWVAGDVSVARTLIRPVHATNTFLLLGSLALTAWWAYRGTARPPSFRDPALRAYLPAVGAVLAVAATGAWTGLAASAFPAETLREGLGQYISPEHLLIYLRMSHPVLALGAAALLLALARGVLREDTRPRSAARRLAGVLAGLVVVQLVAGPLTVALGSPAWARLGHLALADLLWVALVLLAATALESVGDRPDRGRAAGRALPISPE